MKNDKRLVAVATRRHGVHLVYISTKEIGPGSQDRREVKRLAEGLLKQLRIKESIHLVRKWPRQSGPHSDYHC